MLSNIRKDANMEYKGMMVVNTGMTMVTKRLVRISDLNLNSSRERANAVIRDTGSPKANVAATAFIDRKSVV